MTEYHKNGKYDSEGIEAKIGADLKKQKHLFMMAIYIPNKHS